MEYRNELKFVVTDYDLCKIKYRLSTLMKQDAHQGKNGYLVRSIYFDDIYDSYILENESGNDYRKKYRIRLYNGNTNVIHLEKKIKYRGMTQKVVMELSKVECNMFLTCNMEKLYETITFKQNTLLEEVYREILRKRLMPKCIVEYERFALVETKGNVRITFDRNIFGSNELVSFYDRKINGIPIMPYGYHILEIKYDEMLPHYILQAIDTGSLHRQSYSKYCAARKVIG